jgi:hypothetical protein
MSYSEAQLDLAARWILTACEQREQEDGCECQCEIVSRPLREDLHRAGLITADDFLPGTEYFVIVHEDHGVPGEKKLVAQWEREEREKWDRLLSQAEKNRAL